MIDISYTRHAETRMQQRAIRERDIPLIIELGTQVDDETWIYAAIGMLAREIDSPQAGDPKAGTPSELQGRDARRGRCHHRLSLTASGSETNTTPRTTEGIGEMTTELRSSPRRCMKYDERDMVLAQVAQPRAADVSLRPLPARPATAGSDRSGR